MRQYSKEELIEKGIEDRVNYSTQLKHLQMNWNLPDDILIATSVGFQGSHDLADKFIADAEAYDYLDNPGDYWEEFCNDNGLGYLTQSNPFI